MWRHNPNQSSLIFNWTLRNKVQWNFNQNTKRFFRENTFENVTCKMAAILLQSQAEGNEEQYHYGARGAFQRAYELLNLRALKISMLYKNHIFQCTGKIFCVEFQSYLWNSTQNILPVHWKSLNELPPPLHISQSKNRSCGRSAFDQTMRGGTWHIEAGTIWPHFGRRHYQMLACQWKCFHFDINFTDAKCTIR